MSDDITHPASTAIESRVRQRLMNKAVSYLGRYSASEAKLMEVLARFAKRKLLAEKLAGISPADTSPPDANLPDMRPHIAYVAERCKALGYIDDSSFAKNKWRAGLRAGKSPRHLAQKLRHIGVNSDVITALLKGPEDTDDTEDHTDTNEHIELRAAIICARKRRLDPFAATAPSEFPLRQKQLARLVRAGFSLNIARQVLDFESREAAEDWLFANPAVEN